MRALLLVVLLPLCAGAARQRAPAPRLAPSAVPLRDARPLGASAELKSADAGYDALIEGWNAAVGADYTDAAAQTAEFAPESFRRQSFLDKARNEAAVFLMERRLSDGEPAFPTDEAVAAKLQRLERHPLGWAFKGPLYKGLDRFFKQGPGRAAMAADYHGRIKGYLGDFMGDVERYKKAYGAELFTDDGVERAAMNVVTMRLFADLNGVKVPDREAMNAISLLHPVTDDVIDRGAFDPRTMGKITDLLDGKPQAPSSAFERAVFDFVGMIQGAYPRERHPLLHWSLRRMHEVQLRSHKQRLGRIGFDEMHRMTMTKGGLATSIAGYLALGGLNREQFEFFYRSGAVFQHMDDFSDIEEDLADDVATVWTVPVSQGRGIQEPMRRMLHAEKRFERDLPRIARGFPMGASLTGLYSFGFKVTFLRAALRLSASLMPDALSLLSDRLPLSLRTIKRVRARTIAMLGGGQDTTKAFLSSLKAKAEPQFRGDWRAPMDQSGLEPGEGLGSVPIESLPIGDHVLHPVVYDTKTGFKAVPGLTNRPASPAELDWAARNPGLAEALGFFDGTAPAADTVRARVAFMRSTDDALAPAMRYLGTKGDQNAALAAGGYYASEPLLILGGLAVPEGEALRIRERAARGEDVAAEWEALSRARTPEPARAARMMDERRRWNERRGWSFRQEVGLRQFFRLHAPEITETFGSPETWLSSSRRRIMERLGFDFSGPVLKVPSYGEYHANYKKAADDLGIAPEDRIHFVLVYEKPDGSLVVTEPGAPEPAGVKPVVRPLTTREILDLMAAGKFPLAHNEFLDQTGDVFYIHDAVSHGVSFLDKPAYARALIEASRALVRRDGGLAGLGNSVNRNGPLSDRTFYVLEEFMDFRAPIPEKDLAGTLSLPPALSGSAFKDLSAALEKLPREEVVSLATSLMGRMPTLVESIGGNAADDLFTRRDKLNDLKKPVVNKMYFSKTWKMVRQVLADPGADHAKLVAALARLQAYMLALRRLDRDKILMDAVRPEQDETSAFWQLIRGSGVLDPAIPEELALLRNLGLADDVGREAGKTQVEAKFLIPDLSKVPADLHVTRRGRVTQEYVPPTRENLREMFALLAEAGIPFGERMEQFGMLSPGNAAELRLMTKELMVHEPTDGLEKEGRRTFLHVTVKAVGGLSIEQLETPEKLTAAQTEAIKKIFERFRPRVEHSIEKDYLEPVLTDKAGKIVLRPDGKPRTVEIDVLLDAAGKPVLVNGELRFHGPDAVAQAKAWLADPSQRPDYLGKDVSEDPSYKTREISRSLR